jgi:hypothetical protein
MVNEFDPLHAQRVLAQLCGIPVDAGFNRAAFAFQGLHIMGNRKAGEIEDSPAATQAVKVADLPSRPVALLVAIETERRKPLCDLPHGGLEAARRMHVL